MAALRFNLRAFPDSPYAAELRRHSVNRRFCRLEPEYARAQLNENRILIRATCAFAAAVVAAREIELALSSAPNHARLAVNGTLLLMTVLLASVAWSRWFERAYPPSARILVPLRNAFGAVPIAAMAAQGHGEALMLLPLMMMGPFFLLGLSLRVAFVCVTATLAAFTASAVAFALPAPMTLNVCALLFMLVVACTIATRSLDERARRSFLESHLIEDLAQHDGLTGLKNRRVFDEHLARLWQEAAENGVAVAILLVDVDHFKAYNDRHGHQAGDRTLRKTAKVLEEFIEQPHDMLARYGGEEFAAILYDVDSRRAQDAAEGMRRVVAETAGATISVGVAVVAPTPEREPRGALQLADQALYKAKIRGRNCVELMDETEYKLLVTGVFSKVTLAQEA